MGGRDEITGGAEDMKATQNEIRKALIVELSRVNDFDGIKTAFNTAMQDYPENVDDVQRILYAVSRELFADRRKK